MWTALGTYRGPRKARTFIGYASVLGQERAEWGLWRIYMAESLRLQASRKALAAKYHELIRPQQEIDADAVIASVIEGAGLEVLDEPARPDGEDTR